MRDPLLDVVRRELGAHAVERIGLAALPADRMAGLAFLRVVDLHPPLGRVLTAGGLRQREREARTTVVVSNRGIVNIDIGASRGMKGSAARYQKYLRPIVPEFAVYGR